MHMKTIFIAGGCFWGIQKYIDHINLIFFHFQSLQTHQILSLCFCKAKKKRKRGLASALLLSKHSFEDKNWGYMQEYCTYINDYHWKATQTLNFGIQIMEEI